MDEFYKYVKDLKNNLILCIDDDIEQLLKDEKVIGLMFISWQMGHEKSKFNKKEKQCLKN